MWRKLAKKKHQKSQNQIIPLQSMLECIQSLENFLITCKFDSIITSKGSLDV